MSTASSPRRVPPVAVTVVVGLALFVGLVAWRQATASDWVVRGADWNTWYLSARWFGADGTPYPTTRWPVYGALVALFDLLTPGVPLHLASAVFGYLCLAVTGAATFDLGRRLQGAGPAAVATALVVTLPVALELGAWTSAYPLWMASTAVGAAGLAAAADGRRLGYLAAGVGTAITWGCLAKALPGAIGLTGLGLLVAVARKDARGAALFLAPIALLALAYGLFPYRLVSLQEQVLLTVVEGPPDPANPPTPGGPGPDAPPMSGDGYVFGQSMASIPSTLLSGGGRADATWSWARFGAAFPRAVPWLAAWLGLGGLSAAVGGALSRRRFLHFVGWAGVLGIALSVAPAPMALDPQVRFLAPLLPAVGLLFVAPLVPPGRWQRWGAAFALVAIPLAAVPASPLSGLWVDRAVAIEQMATGAADVDTQVWYTLATRYPGRPVVVLDPQVGGTFALEGRDGAFAGPGEPLDAPVTAAHLVLTGTRRRVAEGEPASALGPAPIDDPFWSDRVVAAAWSTWTPGVTYVLLEHVDPAR